MTELTATELRSRGSLKWTFHPEGVLPAWVAEMDFGLAPPIADALHRAIDRGDTGYHSPASERACAEAAVTFWHDRFSWEVEPEQVVFAPDVIEGISRAIVNLTKPGSAVVLHSPVYHPFFSMVDRANRKVIQVPSAVDADGRYRLDFSGIEKAFGEGAGSIVLCNPWNPTGRSFSRAEIDQVIEIARRYEVRVIADEVHAALLRSDQFHTVAQAVDPETVITVTAASKAWNLPGLKCAQVVLSRDDDIAVWNERYYMGWIGVSQLGLVASTAAYADGSPWLDEILSKLDDNRHLFEELMRQLPEVKLSPPDSTYLAWLDFGAYGLEDPAAFLLEHAKVALTSGPLFGVGGDGHARLNFATSPSILSEIVQRIATSLATLR
jgi:cystathionine beta-lyase